MSHLDMTDYFEDIRLKKEQREGLKILENVHPR